MTTYGDLKPGDAILFKTGYSLLVTGVQPGAQDHTVRITAKAFTPDGTFRFEDVRTHRRATVVDGTVTVAPVTGTITTAGGWRYSDLSDPWEAAGRPEISSLHAVLRRTRETLQGRERATAWADLGDDLLPDGREYVALVEVSRRSFSILGIAPID